MQQFLKIAIEAAIAAGIEVMNVYKSADFKIEVKKDNSPLTIADKNANEIINKFLEPTSIPIISEENKKIDFSERKTWQQCWIVDPLDGTKEFIKKDNEFTVNIALISEGKPALGVIFAPALKLLYFSIVSEGKAYKVYIPSAEAKVEDIFRNAGEIKPAKKGKSLKVVGSRSHMNEETKKLIKKLKEDHQEIEVISRGSSLKFCLLAEGAAHYYPRLGPTMEWDTAAGQAICEAVGLKCTLIETGETLTYNRENLLNDHFAVSYE